MVSCKTIEPDSWSLFAVIVSESNMVILHGSCMVHNIPFRSIFSSLGSLMIIDTSTDWLNEFKADHHKNRNDLEQEL